MVRTLLPQLLFPSRVFSKLAEEGRKGVREAELN